jgi:hypothetical protein
MQKCQLLARGWTATKTDKKEGKKLKLSSRVSHRDMWRKCLRWYCVASDGARTCTDAWYDEMKKKDTKNR